MAILSTTDPSCGRFPADPDPTDTLAVSFAASYASVIAFIAVATEGSFARAGDRLGIGRSAVSRSIQKLESQLDTRLFTRTTRSTSLTVEGEMFFANCRPGVDRIMLALDDMQELRQGPPRGRLRVSATVGFGRRIVAPLLNGFIEEYPDIAVDFLLDDKVTDFTRDRVDISFRNGRMEDSEIIAKQLIPMQMAVCATPEYASKYGMPACLEDIDRHHCINFRLASGRVYEWEFKVEGLLRKVAPTSRQVFNDADLVLNAVLAGQGLAQMAGYQVCDGLRDGRLITCLTQHAPDDRGHYLCYLNRRQLPARMRVFIDYMTRHIRALDLQCLTDRVPLEIR